MSQFPKPKVGVSFTGEAPAPEPVVESSPALWAIDPPKRIASGVLLALLCVAVGVVPIAMGSFLPGDNTTVVQNSLLFSWSNLRTIWFSPQNLGQFSPMAYTVLLAEHWVFLDRATGYRLISIALHIVNALLLLRLLNRLELPGAWLGAALFALDPVQVDTVCWVSQQRYLICGVFFISALIVYFRLTGLNPTPPLPLPGTEPLLRFALPERPAALYSIAMVLFVLALLSHVVAATFPLVVLIMIWWERDAITWKDVKPLIFPSVLAVALVALMCRVAIGHSGKLWETAAGWRWLIYVGKGLWSSLLAIVLPISLSFAHPRWDLSPPGAWQLIFTLAAVFVIVAFWLLRARWGRGPMTAAMLFCVLLLPAAFGVNDVVSQPGIMVSEHQIYFAIVAIVVPAAALLFEWLQRRPRSLRMLSQPGFVPTAAIVAGVILAGGSALHSSAYATATTVWQQALAGDGDSVTALNSLGQLELDDKKFNNAEAHFRAALLADPTQTASLYHLAELAITRKDYARAIGLYYQILHQHPDEWDAQLQLADAYAVQGDTPDALAQYHRLLKIRPDSATIYNQLGLIYAREGETQKAVDAYSKSIELDPKVSVGYLNLANMQFQMGKFDDARKSLESVIRLDPHNYVAWLNAGVMATTVGDLESGEKYFRVAMYFNVKNVDACLNLGKVLMRLSSMPKQKSHVDEAISYFKRALSIDASNADAADNLARAERIRDAELRKQQR